MMEPQAVRDSRQALADSLGSWTKRDASDGVLTFCHSVCVDQM